MLNLQAHKAQAALQCVCQRGRQASALRQAVAAHQGLAAAPHAPSEASHRRAVHARAASNGASPPGGGLAINLQGMPLLR